MKRQNTESEDLRLLGESKAMQVLTERQKLFVNHLLTTGSNNMTAAAAAAGYTGTRMIIGRTAHRLAHDPKIQFAIQEEAKRRVNANVIAAVSRVAELVSHHDPKIALKAAEIVMNRGGIHAVSEVKHSHEVTYNDDEMVQRLAVLAGKLGLDAAALLGQVQVPARLPPPIDAEFEEVETNAEPDDSVPEVW